MWVFLFLREVDDSDDNHTGAQTSQQQHSTAPSHTTSPDPNVQAPTQNVPAQPAAQVATTPSTSSGVRDIAVSTDETAGVHVGVKRKFKKATRHEYQIYSDR